MKTLRFTGMLYLTLLHLHTPLMVTATRIFCRAPPVPVGDPANLTCHYPEDLSQSRKNIAVVRRDSTPGSRDDLVISCMWVSEELLCDVKKGFTLFPHQIDYEITFGIPSHKPGTFRCDYIPSDKAVTVQSCKLTLKGSPPRTVVPSQSDSPTDTTERSLGWNEDGDRPPVTTIVVVVMVFSVIVTLAVIVLIVRYCRHHRCVRSLLKRLEDGKRKRRSEIEAPLTVETRTRMKRIHKELEPDGNGDIAAKSQALLMEEEARQSLRRRVTAAGNSDVDENSNDGEKEIINPSMIAMYTRLYANITENIRECIITKTEHQFNVDTASSFLRRLETTGGRSDHVDEEILAALVVFTWLTERLMKHLENISGEQIGENQAQLTEEVARPSLRRRVAAGGNSDDAEEEFQAIFETTKSLFRWFLKSTVEPTGEKLAQLTEDEARQCETPREESSLGSQSQAPAKEHTS